MIFRLPSILSSSHSTALVRHPQDRPQDRQCNTRKSITLSPLQSIGGVRNTSIFRRGSCLPQPGKPYDSTIGSPNLLVLRSMAGEGALGSAWRGYLDLEPELSVAVVTKIGPIKDLIHEASIYHRLQDHAIDGVPTLVGLFSQANTPQHTGYLVLSDEGYRLQRCSKLSSSERSVLYSPSLPKARLILPFVSFSAIYLQILKDIHGAGIIHGDVSKRNLVWSFRDNRIRLAVIDFHVSRFVDRHNALRDLQQEIVAMEEVLDELKERPQAGPLNVHLLGPIDPLLGSVLAFLTTTCFLLLINYAIRTF